DTVDGGIGDDLLIADWSTDGDSFHMNGTGQITDSNNTSVTFANIERFNITFGSGSDSVVLLSGSDTVNGGGGNDDLDTGAGAAVVDGGTGSDRWRADLSSFTGAFNLDLSVAGVQ